jgi:hypothetical protein
MSIKECTEARYSEMLEVLRPELRLSYSFLVGEPTSHRKCEVTGRVLPTYAAFLNGFGNYYEGDDMTIPEFRKFNRNDLPAPK